MTTIRMTNWDKWQSYRRDRGAPPWIKVYRNLMSNAEWASLSDAEKGQLVSIWIVAADKGGEVPANPVVLAKICQLDELPNLNKFIELDFMTSSDGHNDATVTPRRRHADAPETETETETETEKKDSEPTVLAPSAVDSPSDPAEIPKAFKQEPDLKSQLFGPCLAWLAVRIQTPQPNLRSLIGKWCSRFGDGAALEAIMAAQRNSPLEPISYIEKILASKANGNTEAHDDAAILAGVGLGESDENGAIEPGRVEIDHEPAHPASKS